ncbi:MAG: glucosyltransferase domain-containing protein [Lachnospiraceae bacterium]|nr:glucosyltransferase domain-containing protein [Lachnospiraceae bacterium]
MKKITLPNWLKLNRNYQHIFYALVVLFGLYVLPIILANRYYQDDLSRSLRGITGWNNDARPLTEQIMKWLCGGTPIGDIAPLPLLLSVLMLAYILTLYLHQNLPQAHSVWVLLSMGFLVIANPFFLSNLSYRYDCFTMVLALCAAIIPYVLPDRIAPWKVFCFSSVMCMIILVTYQPCCGIYIALCCLELFFMILTSKIDWIRLVIRVISLGISTLLYYFVIMRHYITEEGWQQNAYQFSFHGNTGLWSSVMQNFYNFADLIHLYLEGVPTPIILLFCFLTASGMVMAGVTIWHSHNKYSGFGIFYTLVLPVLIVLGSILPLLVLTPSNFSMSAHTLIVLCSFGLWAGIMVYFLSSSVEKLTLLLLIPCLLFSMTFSYTYGNASRSQKQYEEYMTYNIVHDIESINTDSQYHYLSVDGKMLRSRETSMLCEKYPLFTELIPVYITNSSYLGGALLQHYMQYDLEFSSISESEATAIKNTNPVFSNTIYSCYTYQDKIMIHFNEVEQ